MKEIGLTVAVLLGLSMVVYGVYNYLGNDFNADTVTQVSESEFRERCITSYSGNYKGDCDGLVVNWRVEVVNADFDDNELTVKLVDCYGRDSKCMFDLEVEDGLEQFRPIKYSKGQPVQFVGELDKHSFGSRSFSVSDAIIVQYTPMSDEQKAKVDKRKALESRQSLAYAECVSQASMMSLTSSLSCGGIFAEPFYTHHGDTLYVDLNCTNENAFGVEMKVHLRCENVNGVTSVTQLR